MKKADLPSDRQAKFMARFWAAERQVNVMREGREGAEPYNDATTSALIRKGWIEPSGGLSFRENGHLWEPHTISSAGMYALECYLANLRWDEQARTRRVD